MKIKPLIASTQGGNVPWEWVPSSLPAFLEELSHISSHFKEADHLALYRGHRESDWLLDSTFIRHVKEHVLGIAPSSKVKGDYRLSKQYQRLLGELFLYKFGTQAAPAAGLLQIANEKKLDPWFEYMKRIQQYPNEDLGPLSGSFLLDWSQRAEIAVYFANNNRNAESEGAVWIADISAMGAVLHRDLAVGEILRLYENSLRADKAMGIPLVFCPKNQIACLRSKNQDAIYVAQMDLRCDLEEIWKQLEVEQHIDESVVLKLVLPKGTNVDCSKWLCDRGINTEFIYPDE